MAMPQLETRLPELTEFVAQLLARHQNGSLKNWQEFGQAVLDFFTPSRMNQVERVAPGWKQMASYKSQQTLIHVTAVLTALHLLPEYQQASPQQQAVMQWMVLYHDVAKVALPNKHDYLHGFRSAALAGRGVARAGFPLTQTYPELIDDWIRLTHDAVMFREDLGEWVQDNRQLPEIVSGINHLFGPQTPASHIVKGALLHLSVATDPAYPTVAPLSDDELRRYIDPLFLPLIKMMLLVDADGWDLYDPATQQLHRRQTLAAYQRIAALLGFT